MPILIKDYQWSQSENYLTIRIPLKNINTNKVNILTHKNFLKINFPPYYCEIFLLHEIVEKQSRCKILENEVKFTLKKKIPIEWSSLHNCDGLDKSQVCEKKCEILQDVQLKLQNEHKERRKRCEQIKRDEIQREVEREGAIKDKIDLLKRNAVSGEIEKINDIKTHQKYTEPPIESDEMRNLLKIRSIYKQIKSPPSTELPSPTNETVPIRKSIIISSNIPSIRQHINIPVTFSARKFVTPQRESQDQAEQDWLLKQNEARKLIGFVEEDLRPDERNPEWLRLKGNEFFQKQNYLAAISAYSTAIKLLQNKNFELYLNRAAAHFAIENFKRCIEDCSEALDFLTPPTQSNLNARVTCYARRGAALAKLGFIKQGLNEFDAALKLDPTNETLKSDAEMVRCKLQQSL